MQIESLILGDLHFPFHSKRHLTKVLGIIKRESPKHIIQIGDLFDAYSMSRFPKSYNTKGIYRPIDEIFEGWKCAEEMWRYIRKHCPKSKCYQLTGNHDERFKKTLESKAPELAGIARFDHLFEYDGVKVIRDQREELVINGTAYIHGYLNRMGDHCRYMRTNVVCGHTHRGGLYVTQVKNSPLFELNVGYLGDPASAALSYTKQRWVNWTHGFGIIDNYGPRFCPL